MNFFQFSSLPLIALVLSAIVQLSLGQTPALNAPSTSDGTAIDQGIAYVLLLVALAITYLAH